MPDTSIFSRQTATSLTIALSLLVLITLFTYRNDPVLPAWRTAASGLFERPHPPYSSYTSNDRTDCAHLSGAEDVYVLMKTGAGEARRRVPAHLNTTFRCIPNFGIYSDLEEEIEGHPIHDCLDSLPANVYQDYPEFEFYKSLKDYQKEGNHDYDSLLRDSDGNHKEDAPGWKLDKWKFLPLLDKALEREAKWYFFMEADTYVVWSNLLRWLEMFDASKPWYLGGPSWFGDHIFAHGGTGYVLSRVAVEKATETIHRLVKSSGSLMRLKGSSTDVECNDPTKFVKTVHEDCCGDSVLATAMQSLDIELKTSWPSMQGETPSSLDYTGRHFCWAVVTQHHMSNEEVQDMWDFEQDWLNRNLTGNRRAMTHRDVYNRFVKPIVSGGEREEWDNLSQDIVISETSDDVGEVDQDAWKSVDACRETCEGKEDYCIQYSFGDKKCKLGHVLRLGHKVNRDQEMGAMRSGWMWERIKAFAEDMEPCTPLWIT